MKFLDRLFSWEYGGYDEAKCSCGETFKIYRRIPPLAGIADIESHSNVLRKHRAHQEKFTRNVESR
jgi:hypothetical protein